MNTQSRSHSPLVQLAGIGKSFDGKNVITDFNLTINNGEFLTLLGPSGCGKTTVLRLIAGLENVDAGYIRLDDQEITNVPAEHRHVNTVFQSYALFPHMTVFENVAFGLRMQKPRPAKSPRASPKRCAWCSLMSSPSVNRISSLAASSNALLSPVR
ncbi:Spermidine/putrescine import ABC transporter ATP-binding protein PotA (TC 3.A.1.11.1) [Kosakonia radicincitans]|nr:Spermidine/putrescine import ABC transporter ATP-binding protein PotA (TC 3.A.1.11.1) [Kosakonia radicincitans]